jgi:[ribosomal protein S5]-alanine N-acetyltransferase
VDPQYRPGVIPFPPELSDGQVLLRNWSYDDLPCIEEASNDPVIPLGTTVPSNFSEEAGRAFIERQHGRWATGEGLSLAIVERRIGTAAGLVCLLHRQQPGVVGVGYWVVSSRRKKGLTLASLMLVGQWALRLSAVDRLEALVDPGNAASIRVLEGAGFRREGLLRSYMEFEGHRGDALLYALLESDIDPG